MPGMRVCAASGSRAEFGQLLPLLRRLEADPRFDLRFVVTGRHLGAGGSDGMAEVAASGIPVSRELPIEDAGDGTRLGVARRISACVAGFADYLDEERPDVFVAIGDRYEMFAMATAAFTLLVPIAHICGGSVSAGAVDDAYRHSITKMSSVHFTTCAEYSNRVVQLGEDPARVFDVGSLAIENCKNVEPVPEREMRAQLSLGAGERYCVATYHPATLSNADPAAELREVIAGMRGVDGMSYVVTLSNADAGGDEMNAVWRRECGGDPRFRLVESLGTRRYLSALRYSEAMVGNSSSGTTEGPAMHVPVVNIGDRQKGRLFASGAVHCPPERGAVAAAIRKGASAEARARAASEESPFGDGRASERMADVLAGFDLERFPLAKGFHDLEGSVLHG